MTRSLSRAGIGRSPGTEPERDLERVALGRREAIYQPEKRSEKLLQRGKRELHIALDSDGAGHAKPLPHRDRVVEQRGLADPRLSLQYQDAAASANRAVHQSVERLALAISTE